MYLLSSKSEIYKYFDKTLFFISELWLYIKDAVTNACPMTMDDLVKKMIDCVQAVPPGYLKPVVEASIKRSQSLDLGGLGKKSNLILP